MIAVAFGQGLFYILRYRCVFWGYIFWKKGLFCLISPSDGFPDSRTWDQKHLRSHYLKIVINQYYFSLSCILSVFYCINELYRKKGTCFFHKLNNRKKFSETWNYKISLKFLIANWDTFDSFPLVYFFSLKSKNLLLNFSP